MNKGKRMNLEVRRIVENRKGRQIVESQRVIEKEEITSAEFSEGGNTIYTKRTPRHPNGGLSSLKRFISKVNFQFCPNT